MAAVDPSEPFCAAARAWHPGVDVRRASAEDLPYRKGAFDATLAQLVVHFMTDPVAGVVEMARVTRAARELDPGAVGESVLAGARASHLGELFRAAGLRDVEELELSAGPYEVVRSDATSHGGWAS